MKTKTLYKLWQNINCLNNESSFMYDFQFLLSLKNIFRKLLTMFLKQIASTF